MRKRLISGYNTSSSQGDRRPRYRTPFPQSNRMTEFPTLTEHLRAYLSTYHCWLTVV